jgi:hypothetical protein
MQGFVLCFACKVCQQVINSTETKVYGDGGIQMKGTCPKCKDEDSVMTTLEQVLEQYRTLDSDPTARYAFIECTSPLIN